MQETVEELPETQVLTTDSSSSLLIGVLKPPSKHKKGSSVIETKRVIILIESLEKKVQEKRNNVEIKMIFRGEIPSG